MLNSPNLPCDRPSDGSNEDSTLGNTCALFNRHMSAHLADGDDEDALAAGDAQARDSQVVEVLPRQLGGAHRPPARLREAGHAAALQHLCGATIQIRNQ